MSQQTGVRRVGYRDRSTTEWEPTHPFQPGDLVCVRQLNRAKKGGFPFGSPTTDVAVTRTAVLTDSQDIWIHASRLKLCPKRGEAGDKVPVKAIEDSDNKNVKPTPAQAAFINVPLDGVNALSSAGDGMSVQRPYQAQVRLMAPQDGRRLFAGFFLPPSLSFSDPLALCHRPYRALRCPPGSPLQLTCCSMCFTYPTILAQL
ncbi:uncharacterized protein O3C94_000393 [Discoglossus pictus]